MAPRKKKAEPAVHVVLDTNSLISERIDKLLSIAASNFIKTNIGSLDVAFQVHIPYVVVSERRRQMISESEKLYPNVQKIEKLLGQNFINSDLIKDRINSVIDREISDHDLSVLNADYTKVDWNRVVDAALFREAPFSADTSDKGFKDAIILECVDQLHEKIAQNPEKALLCVVSNDTRLKEGIESRIVDSRNLHICPTFDDLTTVLTAVRSNISQEIADSFVTKADLLFNSNEEKSLVVVWKIRDYAVKNAKNLVPGYELVIGGILGSKTSFTKKDKTKISFRTVVQIGITARKYTSKTVPYAAPIALNTFATPGVQGSQMTAADLFAYNNALAAAAAATSASSTPLNIMGSLNSDIYGQKTVTQTFLTTHEGSWAIIVDWSATVTASAEIEDPTQETTGWADIKWLSAKEVQVS